MNDSFNKIAEALNTTFTPSESLSAIDTQIQIIEDKKKEIQEFANEKKANLTLKDQKYIEDNIKEVIELSLQTLRTVQADIRIGVGPRTVECFAQLSDSIVNQIRELRELNKQLLELSIMDGSSGMDKPKDTGNISMSGPQLLALIESAKKNSELNSIDAEFKIEESDKD